MANTYTRIYLHLVFSPKGRENVIPQKHKEELHKYTTGIIRNRKHKLLAINFMPDHVHIFIGYQEMHHKGASFKEEYLKLLDKFDVDYDPKYLFDWML